MRKKFSSHLLRSDLREQQQHIDGPKFCLTSTLFELYTVRNACEVMITGLIINF